MVVFALFATGIFAQSPDDLPGLELWVRGDSALEVVNDRLAEWGDLSENERSLTQSNPAFRPLIHEDTLAGHTVIGFDGTNHRLVFDEVTTIRTMFMVFRETEGTTGFRVVLGHSDLFPFFRGPDNNLWHFIFTAEEVLNGTTRLNFNEVDGSETVIPQGQYQILSVVTTGNVPANQFGQDRGNPQLFRGELAELIITSQALDSAAVVEMENHLADYYSPQLDLGPDIDITDSFCDTTLSATPGFASYNWSTGESTASIQVNQEGTFWVEATDDFGRTQTDTIQVSYPGDLFAPQQAFVCLNDSLIWDPGLDNTYTFEWSNGTTEPTAYFSTEGPHDFTVTDLQGCSQTSQEWMLQVDSFAVLATLGPDVDLCAGNALSLQAEGYNVENYLWQDEFTTPELPVATSGEYWLEAVSDNGCTLQDTISVEIVGLAPDVEILAPPFVCQFEGNSFQSSASSEDSVIDSYEWSLNDELVSNETTFEWTPENTGAFNLTLRVSTEAGCNAQTTLNLNVNPQPQGSIMVDGQCAGDEITFSTLPEIESGTVTSVEWFFAAEAADGESATFIPDESGFQEVQLILTSNTGCVSEVSQLVNVQPTPIVSFTAPSTCEGDLMPFTSEVDENGAGAIIDYSWFFGDGGASGQSAPAHFYSNAGTYQVAFGATGMNGCTGWFSDEVQVIAEPSVTVPLSNACAGIPYQLQSEVSSMEPVTDFLWTIEGAQGGSEFSGESIEVILTETGFQPYELVITTESGCTASTSGQLPVFAPPVAAFSFTPEIGAPPLEVSFTNESEGASTADWDFGDGFASGAFAPIHTYEEEGSYEISLAVENIYGCPDTARRSIDVTEPVLELIAQQLFVNEQGGQLEFTMQAINQSNFTLSEADFRLSIGNGSTLIERSQTPWQPGEVKSFTWNAAVEQSTVEYPLACAEVIAVTDFVSEANTADNRICKEVAVLDFFAPPFPNPVGQGQDIQLNFSLRERAEVHLQVVDGSGRIVVETVPEFRESGFQNLVLNTLKLRPGHYRVGIFTNGERTAVTALQVR